MLHGYSAVYSTILTGMATLARSRFQLSTVVGTGIISIQSVGQGRRRGRTRALGRDDGVHRLGGAEDGIDRAALDYAGATMHVLVNEATFLTRCRLLATSAAGDRPHQVHILRMVASPPGAPVDLVAIGGASGVGLAAGSPLWPHWVWGSRASS